MTLVELYEAIRRDTRHEKLSIRALADRHGVRRRTKRAALASAVPAPRKVPVRVSPELEAAKPLIDAMLVEDPIARRKQRHTARRMLARHRVKYALVNELVEAAHQRQLSKTIARYGRVDLLCPDELGFLELDRRGAEQLFQVRAEREATNSVAIASNEGFSGWTETFTDPRLCAAIVDWLTVGGNVIETGTVSCRLAHARAGARQRPGPVSAGRDSDVNRA